MFDTVIQDVYYDVFFLQSPGWLRSSQYRVLYNSFYTWFGLTCYAAEDLLSHSEHLRAIRSKTC